MRLSLRDRVIKLTPREVDQAEAALNEKPTVIPSWQRRSRQHAGT